MKPAGGAVLTGLRLTVRSEESGPELGTEPLYRQLYREIRAAILSGSLAPGSRLPASRTLAADLAVSRNTVKLAFEMLLAEGYLEARTGAGSFVSRQLPEEALTVEAGLPATRPAAAPDQENRRLSASARRLLATTLPADPRQLQPFSPGVPDLEAFPLRVWQRLTAQVETRLGEGGRRSLAHGPAQGLPALRQQVAAYLATARGVHCSADEVLILSSSQQGLDLACRVLLDPGDEAWIEEPGYLGVRGALTAAGARLVPVPVDGEGLDVAAGRRRAPEARLACVTPSHQYPLGSVLSLRRRLELLAWAAGAGAFVLEDDYDSEYRYEGRPLQALQGLEAAGRDRVIYIGTFTKVLFPSLRLAYLVSPPDLLSAFVAARQLQDGHAPFLSQAVTAEFMAQGHFMAHLRRMRGLYARRRETLRRLVSEHLRPWLAEPGSPPAADEPAGMHLTVTFAPEAASLDAETLRREGSRHGLDLRPLSRYYLDPRAKTGAAAEGLVLGYTAFSEAQLAEGVRRLRAVFESG